MISKVFQSVKISSTALLFDNQLKIRIFKNGLNYPIQSFSTNSSNSTVTKLDVALFEKETHLSKNNEFIISDDFKEMLNRTFKKPIRLIDKQVSLKEIIFGANNVFELFYLMDNFHSEFTHHSLLFFINKLKKLLSNSNIECEIPLKVKFILTKVLIKSFPSFEANDCLSTFFNLNALGFKINDLAYHAAMQILKFHLNQFFLDDFIRIKRTLNKMKGEEENFENEYVQNLEKALYLAVEIKLTDIDNILTANHLIKHFGNDLSYKNVTKIRKYIDDYRQHYGRNQYKFFKNQSVNE